MMRKLGLSLIAALGYATILAAYVVNMRSSCGYDIFWWLKR